MSLLIGAVKQGKLVVRLHSGDPALYGAINEQIAYLTAQGVDVEVVPGVTAALAAAAVLKRELTTPELTQTVIITRLPGRTMVPEKEQLKLLAKSQSTLCLYLSATKAKEAEEQLLTAYPPTTPVALVYKASQPQQKVVTGTLKQLAALVAEHKLERSTVILVGEALKAGKQRSQLYASNFSHTYRQAKNEDSCSAT
jgi:precorrin-4/cobalt-precorrin-4 C11-methyltransferase